jgi:predicted amidohydrolase YtcJ
VAPEHPVIFTRTCGHIADLVVLADDPARVPVTELRHLPAALTMVGGDIVHEG